MLWLYSVPLVMSVTLMYRPTVFRSAAKLIVRLFDFTTAKIDEILKKQ